MSFLWISLAAAAILAVITVVISYYCYRLAFYSPDRDPATLDIVQLPEGPVYEPFHQSMEKWIRETRALPQEKFSITSFDGLKLIGRYYEYSPDAPIELMFHGYRGTAERDLSGGVQRCFKLGHSSFVVDQRSSTYSEGNVISFGINEHRDCLAWVDFMIQHFGPDVKIILTGISMGAATVMMAAGTQLPPNVIGILADCGYTSAKDIIQEVLRQMKLPPTLVYPFVRLGAKLFGHFDLEETSPVEALKKATVPVIFFHGESDDFVPCYMSRENYEACAHPKKKLVTVPGAAHGLSYPMAVDHYLQEVREFFGC